MLYVHEFNRNGTSESALTRIKNIFALVCPFFGGRSLTSRKLRRYKYFHQVSAVIVR
jgi:hypothetical protein